MSYLNDVYFANPDANKIYKYVNDGLEIGWPLETGESPSAILVASTQKVYVSNADDNSVSIYFKNKLIKKIDVGVKPMGMCEDVDGNIYVCNYGSKNITKIVKDRPIKDIYVGRGPKAICCTTKNELYVALYDDSMIIKLVSDIISKQIQIAKMPNDIVSDSRDTIWVVCEYSNCVSKIIRDSKVKDIYVGRNPHCIFLDSFGNKWVTNFHSNTVSKIIGDRLDRNIVVGDRPDGIAITNANDIYIFNTGSGNISKIVDNEVRNVIKAYPNVVGVCDPTGYKNHVIKQAADKTKNLITWDNLDPALQNLIKAGATDAVTLPINDSDVLHSDKTYDTVDKALNHLLYTEPEVTLTNNINYAEVGDTIKNVIFSFTTNKDMKSLTIDNGVGDVTGLKGKNAIVNVKDDITFTITAIDDKNKKATASTSIKFLNKIYYGTSPDIIATGADLTKKLSNKVLTNSKSIDKIIDCTGGQYIYIAMPTTYNLLRTDITVESINSTAWDSTTIEVTNDYGHTENYILYKTTYLQHGEGIRLIVDDKRKVTM